GWAAAARHLSQSFELDLARTLAASINRCLGPLGGADGRAVFSRSPVWRALSVAIPTMLAHWDEVTAEDEVAALVEAWVAATPPLDGWTFAELAVFAASHGAWGVVAQAVLRHVHAVGRGDVEADPTWWTWADGAMLYAAREATARNQLQRAR